MAATRSGKKGGKKAATEKGEENVKEAEVKDSEDVEMEAEKVEVGDSEEVELEEFNNGEELIESDPEKALALFKQVIDKEDAKGLYVKIKEQAIYNMTRIYAKQLRTAELKQLLQDINPFFSTVAKAKTAKIVRGMLEISAKESKQDVTMQSELCQNAIDWCTAEKRTFLKQRMECKMAALKLDLKQYKEALKLISRLVREVKKFDDKLLLVEIELVEARVHLALQNMPKAKGALTAARSAANSVYCSPLLQAQIDLMAGTLCAKEKDFKTSFSYFYEAFEGYNTINMKAEATSCLKYMLLAKIMCDAPDDVYGIVNGKAGVKYAGPEVMSMKKVADAYKKRSIHAFEAVYTEYKADLADDELVNGHLTELKDKLLEQNLIRLVEPFSRVQVSRVAELINLPLAMIEAKLSEMILDHKLPGILDQGTGDLIVFDEEEKDKTYEAALDTIKELSGVVDKLYIKANKLHAS